MIGLLNEIKQWFQQSAFLLALLCERSS